MTVCLDSWAVIAWLENSEPASSAVESVIDPPPVISWINLAEIFYRFHREYGEEFAVRVLNDLRLRLDCELPTERRIVESALIKARHPIALADCFAISTATDNGAVLYTGDPEILGIDGLPCAVRDLRV